MFHLVLEPSVGSKKNLLDEVIIMSRQCPGQTAQTTTPSPAAPLPTAGANIIDSPDIQAIHQQAYDGLQKAFLLCDRVAISNTDSATITNVLAAFQSLNDDGLPMAMFYKFAIALSSSTTLTIPAYTDTWSSTSAPSASGNTAFFASFFQFALSRLPRSTFLSSSDSTGVVLDGAGNPMSCAAADGNAYQTFYDFHVARLAQLTMCKVMFSLAMSVTAYTLSPSYSSSQTQRNSDLQTLQGIVGFIEDGLSTSLADGGLGSSDNDPEAIYLTIKTISSKNLTDSQTIQALQDAIASRRSSLQTALNAELQIDSVAWWSTFWKWIWIVFFNVGVSVIAWAAASGHYILIYGALATIVVIQVLISVMNWLGYNGTLWDVSGINDSIALSLGIPNFAAF